MFNLSYANFSNTYRHHARQDRDTLLASLGWQAGQGAAGHRNGALCVSLALLGAGVPLAGNRRIEQGAASGKRVFTGANALADWLDSHHQAGETLDLAKGLAGRRGIIAFLDATGPQGGYIGLLDPAQADILAWRAGTRHTQAIRFWPLN